MNYSNIKCLICKTESIRNSANQKYCDLCSKEVRRKYKNGLAKKWSKKPHVKLYRKNWRLKNRIRLNEKQNQKHKELKLGVLTYYGGKPPKCNCCNTEQVEFLTIDHINNDGAIHRKELKLKGGTDIYRWLRKNNYPIGFQVLCFNCNFAKGHFDNCPHQR